MEFRLTAQGVKGSWSLRSKLRKVNREAVYPRKGLQRKSFFAMRSKRKKDWSGKPGPVPGVSQGQDAPF
jgi:hypothetical protein